jgi:hypothetical protein
MLRLSPLPLALTLLDQQALQLPLALSRSLYAHLLIPKILWAVASLGRVGVGAIYRRHIQALLSFHYERRTLLSIGGTFKRSGTLHKLYKCWLGSYAPSSSKCCLQFYREVYYSTQLNGTHRILGISPAYYSKGRARSYDCKSDP